MANEFHYSVSLSILHPSADPKSITKAITSLRPKIEHMAGTERRRPDGTVILPPRKSPLSHWSADLHEEERLYSGDQPFSDFVLQELDKLKVHAKLFDQLLEEGWIHLFIGWFSQSNCAAEILRADMLKACGDLGIDIELHCYAPSDPIAAPAEPAM